MYYFEASRNSGFISICRIFLSRIFLNTHDDILFVFQHGTYKLILHKIFYGTSCYSIDQIIDSPNPYLCNPMTYYSTEYIFYLSYFYLIRKQT